MTHMQLVVAKHARLVSFLVLVVLVIIVLARAVLAQQCVQNVLLVDIALLRVQQENALPVP